MNDYSIKYNKEIRLNQLEMSFGKANFILRKRLLFYFCIELNKDICYRCNKKIETLDEFSIEHKEPWLYSENPKEKFFDLNNIVFSHLSCNSGAGRKNKIYKSKQERWSILKERRKASGQYDRFIQKRKIERRKNKL